MRPGAQVILVREPSTDDHIKIEKLIDAIGERIPEEKYYANCRIVTTKPISGSYEGEGVPFTLKLISGDPYPDNFGSTPDDIFQVFSLRPCAYIDIYAWLSGLENHRIVGELALYLARTFEGVIDLDGLLIPYSAEMQHRYGIDYAKIYTKNWADVSEVIRKYLKGIPGRILEIPYLTANGRTWYYQICDIEFMAAWLKHPDFHMIA